MTKYRNRLVRIIHLNFLKVAMAAIALNILFFPVFTKYEKTEQNMFKIFLDGTEVGTIERVDKLDSFLREARLTVAKESGNLVLLSPEITFEGMAVTYGATDSEETIKNNMVEVLKAEAEEALQHSYTVKINEFTVSLANSDEVRRLLQAAVDRFDQTGSYRVELVMDGSRELNVLTTNLVQARKEQEETLESRMLAGFAKDEYEIFENIEPDTEKQFSDFELGFMDISFAEDIEIVESYLPADQLTPIDEAIELVTKEQEVETIYEVVSGDTLGKIAIENELSLEELIAMNPTLENENSMIRVGDELIVTVPKPELSVNWQEQVYYEEDYEAEVQYIYNDEWYTTKSVTLQEPTAGHRKVVAIISYTNDTETNREIQKEEVTMEAVPKIVEKGTKIPPTYIKPISGGRLSSGFGSRKAPTKGASTYHKGVDWATPIGTSVVASCSGKVVQAGWGSGYGYVVYIDHEDGRQTRYGHLSKVLVKPGQYVNQGDKIALSGNTGRSTGPHLHFEIRINGSPVNPLKYLN